ncbi:NADH-quinone oxidoreductase subunit I, partial [Streptomyces violaceoruber]
TEAAPGTVQQVAHSKGEVVQEGDSTFGATEPASEEVIRR